MKTKIITSLKKELLLVELPKDTQFDVLVNNPLWKDGIKFLTGTDEKFHFIKGSYTLLGKPDEIKEEDAKAFVDRDKSVMFEYKNYNGGKHYLTDLESYNSALESEIYWNVNPLGTEPNHIDYKFEKYKGEYHFKSESHKSRYGNAYEKWQQAEFDTFNKNRTLIFVKN